MGRSRSARLGLLTDPAVVVQHVAIDDQGNEVLTDVAELERSTEPCASFQ